MRIISFNILCVVINSGEIEGDDEHGQKKPIAFHGVESIYIYIITVVCEIHPQQRPRKLDINAHALTCACAC